jgi:hypothetical protein
VAKSAFRPEPRLLETEIDKPEIALGITKKDEQNLDRWHRNQGRTDHEEAKNKVGAEEGNLRTLKHGIFADRCLTPEEKVTFDSIIEKLHADFQFNKSSDFLQVELVGIYSVKLVRAQIEGNTQAAESLDRMIRCHMKDLKTTKIAREGEEPKGSQTSPAECAAALLEKVGEAAAHKTTSVKKPKKSSDNTKASKRKSAKD